MKKGQAIPCTTCDRPALHYNNLPVLNIWKKYRNGICGEGIDMLAIDKAMEYELIPFDERPFLAQKIIMWCTIIINKSLERLKTNG